MSTAQRNAGLIALLLLLGACATAPSDSEPAQPIPTTLQLTVTGATEPVLGADGKGQIELTRDGSAEPIGIAFENGITVLQDLQPGQYSITKLGLLRCRGLDFEVDQASSARALGSLQTKIITTDYYVAMMSRKSASIAEIAELAESNGAAPDTVDARPITLTEAAPCFMNTAGPELTWQERPLRDKITLGIAFGAFCALALAAGGFCAF